MNKDSFSIALACVMGATIGALTALEISNYYPYLWIVGALIGGFTAYVVIDFRHLCAGVANSYQKTIAWRPDTLWWKAFGVLTAGILTTYFSIVGIFLLVTVYFSGWERWIRLAPVAVFVFMLALVILPLSTAGSLSGSRSKQILRNELEIGKKFLLHGNPIGMTILLLVGLTWLVLHIPSVVFNTVDQLGRTTVTGLRRATQLTIQFITGVFVYVHSQRRTICFVDATFGAMVGYYYGSVLIGAIAGGILGFVNYEVVSIRLLRLTPSR